MDGKATLSSKDIPLGAAFTCSLLDVSFNWGSSTSLQITKDVALTSSHSISRHLARLTNSSELYPLDILKRTEVDHWLTVSFGPLVCKNNLANVLMQLNQAVAMTTFLVGNQITIADLEVFGVLLKNPTWKQMVAEKTASPHVIRWYNTMSSKVSTVIKNLPKECAEALNRGKECSPEGDKKIKREDGGKFVELPGAEMGKVVVRFPPEASGFLHIGHAKAALLNQHYQKAFKGKLVMRFDDTNPAKESAEFEQVILGDLKLLEIEPDIFTHTSDHFDRMLGMCEDLMRKGHAYVDNTGAETMKKEREERKESANRNNPVDKNLKMWEAMKVGSKSGLTYCVRAKIDMNSDNGCLRDPTIYRCKPETHVRTGNKYKVYPTYDFACPIVDSVEGVTHALRTTEYHDRDDQYYWFIEKLGLRTLHVYEYSRLNLNHTVLSKRRLTWFVEEGIVDGWDDPRFPTVRGIIRRGMTIEGLKDFIIAQGSSRSVVNMDWGKIWSFNKKVIDRDSPRYTSLEGDLVPVIVSGVQEEAKTAQKHPKDPSMGMKTVWVGPNIFIEREDANQLKIGENATFINWGNLLIKKVNKFEGTVQSVEVEPNLSNTDFKKTLKLTWLAETSSAPWTPLTCLYFDHLISKSILGKDEDFKDYVGTDTKKSVTMYGDHELRNLKFGDIIQLQRKGFFRVDRSYRPISPASCKEGSIILIYIPDGHSKEPPAHKNVPMSEKEKASSAKGKASEKSPVDEVKSISQPTASCNAVAVHEKITEQGNKIRQLKSDKADKATIMPQVEILKALKEEFKKVSGDEWKPDVDMNKYSKVEASKHKVTIVTIPAIDIHNKIKDQGDKIRKLKGDKAEKSVILPEVDALKNLKEEFKKATGDDWKPDIDISKYDASSIETKEFNVDGGSSEAIVIHGRITEQGNVIRDMKAKKADKASIIPVVEVLKALKDDFKKATGVEWKPDIDISKYESSTVISPPVAKASIGGSLVSPSQSNVMVIHGKITMQGDKIRELKSSKAEISVIMAEVDVLKVLKEEFKKETGDEWKPGMDMSKYSGMAVAEPVEKTQNGGDNSLLFNIHTQIKEQGDKVRNLKNAKEDKAVISEAVNRLLVLKKDFKEACNIDWKPDINIDAVVGSKSVEKTETSTTTSVQNPKVQEVDSKIKLQGEKIRKLKSDKVDKNELTPEVNVLLALKKEFKDLTNDEWKPDGGASSAPTKKKSPPPDQNKKEKRQESKPKPSKDLNNDDFNSKKQTRLGLEVKKEECLSEWYTQVITKSEMIEYYNVSGCYILRPWAYGIWESIKDFFDGEIKKMGIENCYFPIFVSKDALEKEKAHIDDFSPEVAWVTHSGSTKMAEPVAIRPTSETVMYPAFAKWIQSYRDLPMRLNQWNNVVRWEFKQPTPFLRTREFLWQEGHTAHAYQEDAVTEVHQILELYARIYEELLAIPVVRGRKSEKEKFAGSNFSASTEAFISASGRGIQGATSHHLGQNFSKMFDIVFEDPKTQEKAFVYQNSWGVTTRTIGVMVMVHGDNKGLVLPPRVASVQAIIMAVGVTAKTTPEEKEALIKSCSELEVQLNKANVRVRCDLRDHVTPAWKFNHWELKGVPLRLELGPKEVSSGQVFVVRRDTGQKVNVSRASAVDDISNILQQIQLNLFNKAKSDLDSHKLIANDWPTFIAQLEGGNINLSPYCGVEECEDEVKKDSARDESLEPGAPSMGAKTLCIPFEQPTDATGMKCIHPRCKNPAKFYALFGRSY